MVERIAICPCGDVSLRLAGDPVAQVFCHCDDCQRAHGAAYVPRMIYPRDAVMIASGDTRRWINRTRTMVICASCGSHLYGEQDGVPFRGVNAGNLAASDFAAEMHLHCRFAVVPVIDSLPHYVDFPEAFGGTGARADW